MRLYVTPASPWVRRVRVTILELGIEDRFEFVQTRWPHSWGTQTVTMPADFTAATPVLRIPALDSLRSYSWLSLRLDLFAGLTVALVTPFRNGEVDFDDLRRLVEWHVGQGTDCLAPVGTTGESPTLDHEEHERVIAAVIETARGAISRRR